MHSLRMLEQQKTWKREADFDRIDTAAEMDAQRFRTSLVSGPFYSKLFNPRWPHTPDEYKFEMRVDVERLRMEIVLSQPAPPPQCDPSPQRLPAVDTGSEEPGAPRRLPVIGTGSDELGVSRAETQSTEREEMFPLQANVDVFLRFNCTILEQECILFQPDVGVDDYDETKSSKVQAGARKEFAGLTIGRQQRETASTEQSQQFDPGGSWRNHYFSVERNVLSRILFARFSPIEFFSVSSEKQVREARIIFTQECESDWDAK